METGLQDNSGLCSYSTGIGLVVSRGYGCAKLGIHKKP